MAGIQEVQIDGDLWKIADTPGYQGKNKDTQALCWNEIYGKANWRLAWVSAAGDVWDYLDVFYKIYVPGYARYFEHHIVEAQYVTENFAYGYDKDLISREEAFDPLALYNKRGFVNQFHHVSFNIALEYHIGFPFRGEEPIQVREGKPKTDPGLWPRGWRWSPGRIPTNRPELIPDNDITGWWEEGSVEDLYQKAKVLLVRPSNNY